MTYEEEDSKPGVPRPIINYEIILDRLREGLHHINDVESYCRKVMASLTSIETRLLALERKIDPDGKIAQDKRRGRKYEKK